MRKGSLVWWMLVGAGLLLLACGGEDDSTVTGDAPEAATRSTASEPAAARNRAPEISGVRLMPEAPTAGDVLSVSVDVHDPDGDELELSYRWLAEGVEGNEREDRFELHATESGAQIQVQVSASDGKLTTTRMAAVRIGNQPPVLQAVVLEPLDQVRAGRDVTASPRATDPDGDEIRYEFVWSVNGMTVGDDRDVLSHEHYQRGDRIQVSVTASDGRSESEVLESAPIPVVNAPPRITSRPGAFDEDGSFRYTITAEDPDGDTQFRYRLLEGPEGMDVDPTAGDLLWQPEEAQAGEHDVEVEVADIKGGRAKQRFVITLAFEDVESAPAAAAD